MEKNGVQVKNIQNGIFGAEVLVAIDGEFAGYLVIADTVKKDAKSAIGRLKRQNIVTAMLTGDAKNLSLIHILRKRLILLVIRKDFKIYSKR